MVGTRKNVGHHGMVQVLMLKKFRITLAKTL